MARCSWRSVVLAAGLALGAAPAAWADAVVTMSGKRVDGTIVSETADEITIRTTDYGDLKFRKVTLKDVLRSSGSGSGFGSTGSGTNPFGGTAGVNPFGDTSGSAPFGDTGTGSVAVPTPQPTPEPVGQRAEVTAPAVPFSWDAVLFSVPEGRTVSVAAQPGQPQEPVAGETTLRNGAEIVTGEGQARIVFKSGQDVMRVSPHTSLTVLESTAGRIRVDLKRGSIWMQTAPSLAPNRVIIETSHAFVIGESGVFRVADALDRGFHVACVEGTAVVQSSKAQIVTRVNEGEMVLVRPDGSVTEPLAVTRPVRLEDAQWDTVDSNWWFETERTEMPGLADPMLELVSINELQGFLRTLSEAFLRFAEDTGHIPTSEEAFSVLRQNTGGWAGWQGPYAKGLLPPLDSWGRPLKYVTRRTGHSDNVVGIVYSTGEDNFDNEGDPSADVSEMVLYYQLENVDSARSGSRP